MTTKEFQDYWKNRIEDPSFLKAANKLYKGFIETFLDFKIDFILSFAKKQIETIDINPTSQFLSMLQSSLRQDLVPIFLEQAMSFNLTIDSAMDEKTKAAWKKALSQKIKFPPDTVSTIIQQPAIKELFTNVIHTSIIAFNKKVNPFHSAFSAFGLEKQIKEFIKPFMDNVLETVAEFITHEENEPLFEDFATKVFEFIIAEKPELYLDLPLEQMAKTYSEAISTQIVDEKGLEISRKISLDFIQRAKKKFKNQTIREYFKANRISMPSEKIEKWHIEHFRTLITGEAFSEFMAYEVELYVLNKT